MWSARAARRQANEWKVNFGVWAAQLAAVGVLLGTRTTFWSWFSCAYLAAGGVLVALHAAHVAWFVMPRNNKDAEIAIHYENRILDVMHESELPRL